MATFVPDAENIKAKALQAFVQEFGVEAIICACAPGRVNLIGEHTDYNEGFVLPMVIYENFQIILYASIICFVL